MPASAKVEPAAVITRAAHFNGYFLKVMQYVTGDRIRYAPLLVGKLGWTPPIV